MAEATTLNRSPLTRAEVEGLASAVDPNNSLSLGGIWLHLRPDGEDPQKTVVALFHVVLVRQGGFMIIGPDRSEYGTALENLGTINNVIEPAFHTGAVQFVTSRGRPLGAVDCLLADLPWEAVEKFYLAASLKSNLGKHVHVDRVAVAGAVGKPSAGSAIVLAQQWISGSLDEETAEEYHTALERAEESHDGASLDPADQTELLQSMQQQLLELQNQVKEYHASRPNLGHIAPPKPPLAQQPHQPGLFQGQTSSLGSAEWGRLQRLAGAPPTRVGTGEPRQGVQSAQAMLADQHLAEFEKGAGE